MSSAPASIVCSAWSWSARAVSTITYGYGTSTWLRMRRELRAVHLGHLPVGDHDVGRDLLEAPPRLRAVLGQRRLVAEPLDGGGHDQARARIVVGDEDVHEKVEAGAGGRRPRYRPSGPDLWTRPDDCPCSSSASWPITAPWTPSRPSTPTACASCAPTTATSRPSCLRSSRRPPPGRSPSCAPRWTRTTARRSAVSRTGSRAAPATSARPAWRSSPSP